MVCGRVYELGGFFVGGVRVAALGVRSESILSHYVGSGFILLTKKVKYSECLKTDFRQFDSLSTKYLV